MVWSPELTATPGTGPTEWSSRLGQPVRLFQVHHTANFNIDNAYALMLPGDRTVSCNALVGPKGEKWGVVPEEYRAFTSGSAMVDRMSYTVETVNSTGAPTWGISAAAHEALVDLLVDVATRHKFWPNRQGDKKTWTVIGHREIGEIWPGESYATACPGGIDLGRLTTDAQKRLSTVAPPVDADEEDELKPIVVERTEYGREAMVVAPWVTGATTGERGYRILTTDEEILAVERMYARGSGTAMKVNRSSYIAIQSQARIDYAEWRKAVTPPEPTASTPTTPAPSPLISSYVLTGTLTPKEA